jgi:hypothetical protein
MVRQNSRIFSHLQAYELYTRCCCYLRLSPTTYQQQEVVEQVVEMQSDRK